jgi:hypothetical protein
LIWLDHAHELLGICSSYFDKSCLITLLEDIEWKWDDATNCLVIEDEINCGSRLCKVSTKTLTGYLQYLQRRRVLKFTVIKDLIRSPDSIVMLDCAGRRTDRLEQGQAESSSFFLGRSRALFSPLSQTRRVLSAQGNHRRRVKLPRSALLCFALLCSALLSGA